MNKPDFEKAFYILMDYWDSIPEEHHEEIDKKLKKILGW